MSNVEGYLEVRFQWAWLVFLKFGN